MLRQLIQLFQSISNIMHSRGEYVILKVCHVLVLDVSKLLHRLCKNRVIKDALSRNIILHYGKTGCHLISLALLAVFCSSVRDMISKKAIQMQQHKLNEQGA